MCCVRKVFVGGLHIDASEVEVRNHFSQFGEVLKADIKCDPVSGRSRGFAFVAFATEDGANKAIEHSMHYIRGKSIDVKRVKPPAPNCKIFVGGVKPELSLDDVRKHFESYGGATDIEMPMDRVRNHHKGFCFVTLQNEDVVNQLVDQGKTAIKGVTVDVRKATPKSARMQQQPQQPSINPYQGGYGGGYPAAAGNGYDPSYAQFQGYGGFDYSAYGYGSDSVNYGAGYGAQPAGYAGSNVAPTANYGASAGQGANPYGAPAAQGATPYGAPAGRGSTPYGGPPVPGAPGNGAPVGFGRGYGGFQQPPPQQQPGAYDSSYTGKQPSNRGHAPRHQPY